MDASTRFADEQRALLVERSRWLLAFGVLFFPANIPLDHIVAPDIASRVLVVRLGLVVAFALFLGATYTSVGRHFIRAVSVAFALLASLGFAVCTFLHTGFDSTYVVGIMLVMLGSCFSLPWRLGPAAVFCAVSTVGYLGLNLVGHGWSDTGLAWVAFLLGSGSVASLATHLNARGRQWQFDQREELAQAKAELEALGEARTRFFANVSHELRTPLMLILGPLEDLLEDQPGDAVFASMWSNGVRLQRQVEMLLDLACLEVGRLESRPARADLGDVLEGLVEAARPHAERSGIDLVVIGLDELPASLLDPEQIETVAGNLLSNALKFTPEGGRVVVEASASGEMMWFEVRDTGVGIAPDEIERIFDRFHRARGATAPGTGLGLALTCELVELNGGRITARSVEGEGSAFRVVLPYRPVTMDVVHAREQTVEVEVSAGSTRLEALLSDAGGRTVKEEHGTAPADAPHILLVEDNADLRAFVVGQLSRTYRGEHRLGWRRGAAPNP
ncbi:MAG: HAMP domain-containing histidine kinase [Proteobacteria bacterium]|nr:HAMP domain-containing histidine kinase [Pseudomonadota bacterium]MCP4920107.1 HAMP domain-containing histidine kinase [Pseudomonadota bacterium]